MPNRHYKRKLRDKTIAVVNTPMNTRVNTILDRPRLNAADYVPNLDIEALQNLENYFLEVIGMVATYHNFDVFRRIMNEIKNYLNPIVYYLKIIELIENNLISVVENISIGINSEIIRQRINYLKNQINLIPANFQNYDEISLRILEILNIVIDECKLDNFKNIIKNIRQEINDNYGSAILYKNIHNLIIDIVENMEANATSFVVKIRTDCVHELVDILENEL
jgi:hypothetical protein